MNLRDELMAIYNQHGFISPDLVVTVAADEAHPLHGQFEWDDAVAGAAWRREQARQLLRTVRISFVTDEDADTDVRAFYAVLDTTSPSRYRWEPVNAVITDPLSYKLLVREMERDIRRLRARYGHLEEYRKAMLSEAEHPAA